MTGESPIPGSSPLPRGQSSSPGQNCPYSIKLFVAF